VGFHHAVLNEQLTKAFRKPEVLGSLSLTDVVAENEVLLVEWKVNWARVGMARTALKIALALIGGLGRRWSFPNVELCRRVGRSRRM
jgi:hypothetical protein